MNTPRTDAAPTEAECATLRSMLRAELAAAKEDAARLRGALREACNFMLMEKGESGNSEDATLRGEIRASAEAKADEWLALIAARPATQSAQREEGAT